MMFIQILLGSTLLVMVALGTGCGGPNPKGGPSPTIPPQGGVGPTIPPPWLASHDNVDQNLWWSARRRGLTMSEENLGYARSAYEAGREARERCLNAQSIEVHAQYPKLSEQEILVVAENRCSKKDLDPGPPPGFTCTSQRIGGTVSTNCLP